VRRQWTFTVEISKEKDGFSVRCLEIEAYSQGDTKHEALENIKEAIECHMEEEDFPITRDNHYLQQIRVPVYTK